MSGCPNMQELNGVWNRLPKLKVLNGHDKTGSAVEEAEADGGASQGVVAGSLGSDSDYSVED